MNRVAYLEPLLFEAGDRLGRDEFLSRWERMPDLKFAELIDGVVYLPSPLSLEHSERHGVLQTWAGVYAGHAGFVQVLPIATWLMEERSAPQPDLALRIKPGYGGQSRNKDKYAAGAPEFAAEVSRSSRSYDLGPKLELYERAGVKEYLVALVEEQRLEWRALQGGRFQLMLPDGAGIFRSRVLPGLWLDERAFWNNDIPGVLARLEEGLKSAEFKEFRESRQTH
jgi:hypothetical protein